MGDYDNARLDKAAEEFDEIQAADGGKRCAVNWAPWMGDWFVSSSPRNGNSNAEGPWDHWVDLAVRILRDPLTAKVRPEAHAAIQGVEPVDFYSETKVDLTDADLAERFGDS